jgi:hypothetical protein
VWRLLIGQSVVALWSCVDVHALRYAHPIPCRVWSNDAVSLLPSFLASFGHVVLESRQVLSVRAMGSLQGGLKPLCKVTLFFKLTLASGRPKLTVCLLLSPFPSFTILILEFSCRDVLPTPSCSPVVPDCFSQCRAGFDRATETRARQSVFFIGGICACGESVESSQASYKGPTML